MSEWSCGPGCQCNERLGRFQEILADEEMRFTLAEIEAIEAVKRQRMPHEALASDRARVPAAAEVARRMATLKGRSEAELERDDIRGARSPLGGGTGSKRKGRA
jgi:hypothetical protein